MFQLSLFSVFFSSFFKKILWLTLCVFLLNLTQAAAIEVRVPSAAKNPLQEAFHKAVYARAKALLPGKINSNRGKLLWRHVGESPGAFVSSYSEQGEKEDILYYNIEVNEDAVLYELKRIGIYYTVEKPQPYSLTLAPQAERALSALLPLQQLSGCSLQEGRGPHLSIDLTQTKTTKEEQKKGFGKKASLWRLQLTEGEKIWSATGRELSQAWFHAWGHYFNRKKVAVLTDKVAILITGWKNIDEVRSFIRRTQSWKGRLGSIELSSVSSDSLTFSTIWEVQAGSEGYFEEHLQGGALPENVTWKRLVHTE